MNIYAEKCYRSIISELLRTHKKVDPNSSLHKLATKTRISKSYLSKVLNEKAHFNSDQLYLVSQYFELNQKQQRYLQLLLEYARSGLAGRKRLIDIEINAYRESELNIQNQIKVNQSLTDHTAKTYYFLDPLNQLVHIGLSLKPYQHKPELLAEHLSIPKSTLFSIMKQLEQLGVIQQNQGIYETRIKTMHLSKDDPLFKAYRTQIRLISLNHLQKRPHMDDYSLSATFSGSKEAFFTLQLSLLAFIKQAQASMEGTPPEGIYQFNIDLFPW